MKAWAHKQKDGFTIVELLIVVVVIAILAAITVVAYNGIQDRAKNTQVQSDIRQVAKLIETYNADKGTYPSTGGLSQVYSDSNCTMAADSDGYLGVNWVPGMADYTSRLPQNPGITGTGRSGQGGCYMYASDGTSYLVSAWNAKRGGPSTDGMYKRMGFRETNFSSANTFNCNHNGNIGGIVSGAYNAIYDYYKFSYTISNISCNETPPAGA